MGGDDAIAKLDSALADLLIRSGFPAFWNKNVSDYRRWVKILVSDLQSLALSKRLDWAIGFSGLPTSTIHLVVAPGLYPVGTDTLDLIPQQNHLDRYVLVRDLRLGSNDVQLPSGTDLEYDLMTTLAMAIVFPATDNNSDLFRSLRLGQFFPPVEEAMSKEGVTTADGFISRSIAYVVRVLGPLALLPGDNHKAMAIKSLKTHDFYLTDFLIDQLEYYQTHRTDYPTISSFIPFLYRELDKQLTNLILEASPK